MIPLVVNIVTKSVGHMLLGRKFSIMGVMAIGKSLTL